MEAMELNFWKNKKVFLTGHTGFKGSWLKLWLEHLGAQVTGYSLNPNTSPNLFEASGLINTNGTSEFGDVCDFALLEKSLKASKADVVFHLAAQPLVRYSYENPIETYATNMMGTVHLLNAVRATPEVRAVVIVTTDKCYENREWLWGYREDDPVGGFDPYSSSKACAEIITSAMRRSYFNEHGPAIASARAGNVIGGGDWAGDRLIPDIMRAIQNQNVLKIRNPQATRPWQHVLEPLHGYMMLAEALFSKGREFAEAWNFGPAEQDAKSVGEIVHMMSETLKSLGSKPEFKFELNDSLEHKNKLHEAHFLKLDCSKAHALLGWQPRWNAETAILKTAEWYKSFYENPKLAKTLVLKQITDYSHGSKLIV